MTTNNAPMYTFGSYNSQFFASEYLEYPVAQGAERIETLYTSSINNTSAINMTSSAGTMAITGYGVTSLSSTNANVSMAGESGTITSRTGPLVLLGNDNSSFTSRTGTMAITGFGITSLSSTNASVTMVGESGTISTRTGSLVIQGNDNSTFSSRIGTTTIGTSASQVNIPGGISLGDGKAITCSSTYYTPSSSQIGYFKVNNSYGVITATTSSQTLCSMSGLTQGVYLLMINFGTSNATNASAVCQIFLASTPTGCTTTLATSNIGTNGLQATIPVCFTGMLSVTNNTNSITYNCSMTPNGTLQINNIVISAMKIA